MTSQVFWILLAGCLLLALGSRAYTSGGHDHAQRGLRGGDCSVGANSRNRDRAEAERLRRRSERALDRLPLRRPRLGHIDQLVIHEIIEVPVEHSIDRLEYRIREEERETGEGKKSSRK